MRTETILKMYNTQHTSFTYIFIWVRKLKNGAVTLTALCKRNIVSEPSRASCEQNELYQLMVFFWVSRSGGGCVFRRFGRNFCLQIHSP